MKPNIGGNIKKLRIEKQVTQEQIAERLSISYQAVSKWENGVTTPDIYMLPDIAEYFGVPIDELFKVDMKAYRNKAQRLLSVYESTGRDEDYERAEAEYRKLFASNQADAEDFRLYGILNEYRADALNAKAEGLYGDAIVRRNTKAVPQLIRLRAKTGRSGENIAKYSERLKTDPDDVLSWQFLAQAYYYAGDNAEALKTAKGGLHKFPDDYVLLNICAQANFELNNHTEAFDCWNKAAQADADSPDALYGMAIAYDKLGERDKSIDTWEKVLVRLEGKGFHVETDWPKREIERLNNII
jgi:transcriptional regulator with XRE-family HTH domain